MQHWKCTRPQISVVSWTCQISAVYFSVLLLHLLQVITSESNTCQTGYINYYGLSLWHLNVGHVSIGCCMNTVGSWSYLMVIIHWQAFKNTAWVASRWLLIVINKHGDANLKPRADSIKLRLPVFCRRLHSGVAVNLTSSGVFCWLKNNVMGHCRLLWCALVIVTYVQMFANVFHFDSYFFFCGVPVSLMHCNITKLMQTHKHATNSENNLINLTTQAL